MSRFDSESSGRPKVVAIIQARMDSKRLPGKILREIAGEPMLCRVVERARKAGTLAEVVVATTVDVTDDPVVATCKRRGYDCVRGSAQNVLARYITAARLHQAEVVVRLTADCPLIDAEEIDHVVRLFLARYPELDYASNRIIRTYPIGLDVEVMRMEVLEEAFEKADQLYHREHVTPYLYEDPDRYRMLSIESDVDHGRQRWTVDTPEDLEFVRAVYQRFDGRDDFGWREILAVLEKEPELCALNAHIHHKNYRDVEE